MAPVESAFSKNCAPWPITMPDTGPSTQRRRLLLVGATALGAAALPGLMRWRRGALQPLSTTQAAMPDTPVTIALGDPKQFDLHAPGARIDRQPVGMHFYERRWPLTALGTVRYLQGPRSFDLPWVSGVMGSCDPEEPGEGIYAWHVRAFALPGDRMPHAYARDNLFALFRELRRAGWRRFVLGSEPRLLGREALRYFEEQGGAYPLDPAFPLQLEQWMRINLDLPYWQFWADGVYMTLRVIDEPALRHPQTKGVYMFSLELESEAAFFRSYFREVEDMKHWKERIAAELERYRHLRPEKEAELRTQGYTIDETYRDPPILALAGAA